MNRLRAYGALLLAFLLAMSVIALAQSAPVPKQINFSGVLKETSGVVGVTFSIYKDQEGGAPLWMETQNVQPDSTGRYTVTLGAMHTDGVPAEIFTAGEAKWLGVRVEGQAEQAPVLLTSVPYAVKAGDAQTLGGFPLSAFVMNSTRVGGDSLSSLTPTESGYDPARPMLQATTSINLSGTRNQLAKFTDDFLGDSMITDTGKSIGIGVSAPESILQIGGNTSQYVKFNPQPWGLRVGSLQSGTQFIGMGVRKQTANNVYVARTNNAASVAHTVMEFRYDGSLVLRQQSHAADDTVLMDLKTALAVTGAGNVGIGVDVPSAKLEVAGLLKLTGTPDKEEERPMSGIIFPDGTIQTTAQIVGPQGDMGPIGPEGPQGMQGEVGPQGGPGLVARGAWSKAAEDYVLNDLVTSFGSTYRCMVASCTPANNPIDNSPLEWEVLAAKGDRGDTGDMGGEGPQGVQGEQGPMGPQGPMGARGIPGPQGASGVAQMQVLAGAVTGTVAGGQSDWVAIGPTTTIVTSATQRITGLGVAGLGLQLEDEPQQVGVGLCYQPNTGGSLTNFVTSNYTEYVVTPTRSSFLGAGSVVPGAGTWNVSMCVLNSGAADLSNVDYVNGWVMVTNERAD